LPQKSLIAAACGNYFCIDNKTVFVPIAGLEKCECCFYSYSLKATK